MQGVLRHDTGTQLFLLPYFVHAAVCYGTPEAREHVRAEILAVLEEAAHTRPSSPSQVHVSLPNALLLNSHLARFSTA
jgi:hypothetical protein